jgi:hypothetical protein
MPFLTKTVRNLLLAALFGVALVLVETSRVQAQEFPVCYDANMSCQYQGGELVPDPEGQYCHGEPGGFLLTPYQCIELGTEEVLDSGWCFPTDPYGNRLSCEG